MKKNKAIYAVIVTPIILMLRFGPAARRRRFYKPVKSFTYPIPCRRACPLNVPIAASQVVESQFFGNLLNTCCIWKILLIGENEQRCVAELVGHHKLEQLLLRFAKAVWIVRIHNPDDGIRVGVVMSPERPNFVLAAHIPYLKLDVLVCYGLHIETDAFKVKNQFFFIKLRQ